jgi:hypothetical protein
MPKFTGSRGWVPVNPDGLVMWTGASWHRRAAHGWVVRHFGLREAGDDTWKKQYQLGWRVVRCAAKLKVVGKG